MGLPLLGAMGPGATGALGAAPRAPMGPPGPGTEPWRYGRANGGLEAFERAPSELLAARVNVQHQSLHQIDERQLS